MPYSDSTKDLIDKLLKDKKVSWRKQREIKHAMSVGSALPSRKLPFHDGISVIFTGRLVWNGPPRLFSPN